MKTPIVDFVRRYAEAGVARFHMPGHKGVRFLGPEPYDITEIEGADVLYSADGIIEESERNAAALFGTAHTFYSTEGSTLAIKAMLMLVASNVPAGERALILAGRNAHKAFVYGAALLDIDVEWLYPEKAEHLCACAIGAESLKKSISSAERKPAAVYITSPDYLGRVADVSEIAFVCREFDIPLLVDNAHGAYLGFLEEDMHPIALGACMCADSAHKTLPVLTGGAYLHISKNAPREFLDNARHALSVFASTSPSYLILQSLDACNLYLAGGYREKLSACIAQVERTKKDMARLGFAPEESEPLKIVLCAARYGYTGTELCAHLRKCCIEAEFCDDEYLVLMVTPENGADDFARLCRAFAAISPRAPLETEQIALEKGEALMPLRTAMFAPQEVVPTARAKGRVCAAPTVSCPPAVPIAVSGEVITERTVRLFARYGIEKIAVVK